ncbi:MAG: YceI family protein [Acidimicrobiales bacterium]
MSHRARNIIIAVVAAVLLVTVVGPFVYINFIKDDPPERLSLDDATTTTDADDDTSTTGAAAEGIEGTWTVTDDSIVGYRIQETLFGQDSEAVGRSESVTGEVTIEGTTVTAASFEVDMATFESGESRRDGQFENRIMEVAQFPTATFVLTEPVELSAVPTVGERLTATATGDLTLHGVTQPVTIDLVARLDGTTFAVDGTTTVTFSDYAIDDPSGGPASVGDEGELEVLLVFSR